MRMLDMRYAFDGDAQRRMAEYFAGLGDVLKNKKRRTSFAIYAYGLLGEGERKSIEPIAARASGTPARTEGTYGRLLHFVRDSHWSDREVRRYAAQHAVAAISRRAKGRVEAWIIDDTGLLKQGKHSVGVQRQYTGSAGKTANCQIAVSLSVATSHDHAPIDMELYLPESWTSSPVRRKEGRIPDDVVFRTKLELAMAMIDRAIADGHPRGVVLADSAYGDSNDFRAGLRARGLEYGVGIHAPTKVFPLDRRGQRRSEVKSVGELATVLAAANGFRRVTWRQGTAKEKLSARFAARRVIVAHDDGQEPSEREVLWLLVEWKNGEKEPTKFYLLTLPKTATLKELVRTIHHRWRTEQAYEELKGELGFDHYEGRRYPGWHHHASAVMACYAFVVAERARAFPPSAAKTCQDGTNALAA